MATKIIRNIDEEVWRKFTGYCKIKDKKVGELLTEVLYKYLEEKIK